MLQTLNTPPYLEQFEAVLGCVIDVNVGAEGITAMMSTSERGACSRELKVCFTRTYWPQPGITGGRKELKKRSS